MPLGDPTIFHHGPLPNTSEPVTFHGPQFGVSQEQYDLLKARALALESEAATLRATLRRVRKQRDAAVEALKESMGILARIR